MGAQDRYASVTTMDFYLYMGLEPSNHLRNDSDVIRVNWETQQVSRNSWYFSLEYGSTPG